MTAARTCVLAMAGALAACQRTGDGRIAGGDALAAGAELILVGRFDDSDPAAPRFAWSGSTITTRFTGSSIAVDLEESGPGHHYQIVVDGAAAARLATSSGRRTYPVASALGAGRHEVTLHRLTEAFLGETRLHGVALDGGARPVRTASSRARRLELIGDSISAGYGNEGTDETCPFTPATENHHLSWGAVAARALDADLVTIAWSGKGVFSNRGNPTDLVPMPALWTRTLPEQEGSRWDFARYQPDAVVINLGTNDVAMTTPDWSPFPAAYLAFVRDVRARYPDAYILCVLGPMLTDTWPEDRKALTTARQGITAAVAALTADGDAALGFLELPPQDGSTGFGCDWHPSVATHARMASALEAALRARLGW
jgi:lysophospholipase L1-like esterase